MIIDLDTGQEIKSKPTLQTKTYKQRKKKSQPWIELKEDDEE